MQQNIYLANELYDQIKKTDLDVSKVKDSIHDVNLKAEALAQKIEEAKIQSNMKISELQTSIQEAKLEVDQSFPADIEKIKTEISQFESQKATIEGIKVVTPPDYFAVSLKTKQNMLISVSGTVSLLLGICLAFVINWSQQNRGRIGQESH
jgi:uncharacterized protein involved in exopolysaccharide biosynthesis